MRCLCGLSACALLPALLLAANPVSPLDRLNPKNIPADFRGHWQPKELDGVLQQPGGGHTYGVMSMALHPQGKLMVVGSHNQVMRLWDLTGDKPQELPSIKEHKGEVMAMAFTSDGKTLATGCGDNTIRLWDVTGTTLKTRSVLKHHKPIRSLAFTPDGKKLAAGMEDDGRVHWWD